MSIRSGIGHASHTLAFAARILLNVATEGHTALARAHARNRTVRTVGRRMLAVGALAALALSTGAAAQADTYDPGNFEGFALGEPTGQDGWTAFDMGGYNAANFDVEIVDPSGTWGSALGSRALRVSNGVTSGGFGNQLQTPSLANEAGETEAVSGGYSGGTRQSRFSGTITFASATQAYQPGLRFSMAADNGPGTRMAVFYFEDFADGFTVSAGLIDESIPAWEYPVIASGLSHDELHTLNFSVDFVDGESNDVLWTSLGGQCASWSQSGTWETFHRLYAGNTVPVTHTVDSVQFRLSGTAVPANAGNGVLFDTFEISSSTVPAMPPAGIPAAPATPSATVTGQNVDVTAAPVIANGCSPVTAYTATLTPQGGGTPLVLTGASPSFSFAGVPAGPYGVTITAENALGASAASAVTEVTVAAANEPTPNPDPSEIPDSLSNTGDGYPEQLSNTGPASHAAGWSALALLTVGGALVALARRVRA
jgi:hypothetical protein